MAGNDGGIAGTDTMEPIQKGEIPLQKSITYSIMVCDHWPLKTEPNQCRLVVGGDKLTYENEIAAPAANLLEIKLMVNSVISTKGAKFLSVDIEDFFLNVRARIYETSSGWNSLRYHCTIHIT